MATRPGEERGESMNLMGLGEVGRGVQSERLM